MFYLTIYESGLASVSGYGIVRIVGRTRYRDYVEMNGKINCSMRGFTLIELLVVILILSILMAVALPLYLKTVGDSQIKTCRANLQTIAGAVHSARVATIAADFSVIIAAGVTTGNLTDLQSVPICPTGGSYSLAVGSSGTATTYKVICNQHGSFEPGYDHT